MLFYFVILRTNGAVLDKNSGSGQVKLYCNVTVFEQVQTDPVHLINIGGVMNNRCSTSMICVDILPRSS